MRKVSFTNNEHYHIFNRGVDKREVFLDLEDLNRFFKSIQGFNTLEPIGSIYENSFSKDSSKKQKNLVNFICYCINPNHYHFILEQVIDKGIEKFMHRLGVGYTNYFNKKYERSGSLFQGNYKAVHIDSNEYLLHLSAYVNLNNRVHKLGNLVSKSVSKSSWDEYIDNVQGGFCEKDIILSQFGSPTEYREFAENSLIDIRERKEMEKLLLE